VATINPTSPTTPNVGSFPKVIASQTINDPDRYHMIAELIQAAVHEDHALSSAS
jgi:hypothetical protein